MISLIALFIALGGTSYAVVKLPASSVGNRELKRNAVTASKIRDGSIGQAELTAAASPRRGPRGPEGPPGRPGQSGQSGVVGQPEPWQPLAFAGTWTNYAAGYDTGAFRKDQLGRVHLRGLVSKNAGLPAGGEVIATLPPGYRPLLRSIFAVASGAPTDLYGRVDVLPNGEVVWVTGGPGETDFSSLDTISFWTD